MIAVAAVLAALAAGSPETRAAGLVDVHRYGPGIRVELVYRSSRNLTGHRLPGYCREWALLLDPVARDLARVQRRLRRGGLGRHNTGSAVDLTLVRFADGERLRMGSGYDELGPRAHTRNATGRALHNRLVLERAMERFGFTGYWREWWHFEHRVMGARYLDLSLGC